MNLSEIHKQALALHESGRNDQALQLLRGILGEDSEVWSDWSTIQHQEGRYEEAEAGYRFALRLNPRDPRIAANLGVLLTNAGRFAEAIPFLQMGIEQTEGKEQIALSKLWNHAREQLRGKPLANAKDLERFLRDYVSTEPNQVSYFNTHIGRYVATLRALPDAGENQRILELGTAFHHLTAALKHCKGYGEVRCTDVWAGKPHVTRELRSRSGRYKDTFAVDNFDLQTQPWPYHDREFDGVLCCEILEHLYSDPMGMLAEINRVLKPNGFLLLTTPNLASAHAVEQTLAGGSPYAYGKFEVGGRPTDRHNREYTATEVATLTKAAGFEILSLRTQDFYWHPRNETIAHLARNGFPLSRRGDSTILVARKAAPVIERYPEEFYSVVGIQVARRDSERGPGAECSAPEEDAIPKRILLIHEVVPHHDCSGSDLRLYQVIQELCADGHQVTLFTRQDHNADKYSAGLKSMGVQVFAGDPDRLRHLGDDRKSPLRLNEFLVNGQFEVAIVCHWFWNGISLGEHYIDEIRRWSPETRIAVLSDDRHGEREHRSYQLTGLFSDFERGEDFAQRELEVYRQADLLLAISEADHRYFSSLLPDLPAERLPMHAETGDSGPEFAAREGLLFLGNFDNLANRDALHWLIEKVLPMLQSEEPGLKLYVGGHGLTAELCPKRENIVALGKIGELAPAFAARRVFVSPVRFGTGIITKNMLALGHGLPIVTTAVGAEGLQLVDGEHALIADTPEKFAADTLRLFRDPALWNQVRAQGRAYIHQEFSRENLRLQARKILARADNLSPKPFDRDHVWSYRQVEDHLPQVLSQHPAGYRPLLRTLGYWRLGNCLLAKGGHAAALEQFRHVFATLRGNIPATGLYIRMLGQMAQCYEALNRKDGASRCLREIEHRRKIPGHGEQHSPQRIESTRGVKNSWPELSVIIPTFNRRETLQLCLMALATQTLPAERWEVVVVDDGSTDGTETLCRASAYPFGAIRCIRQENQGAGAARRKGVAAARGEFLLFLNDDTIATPTLLAEHLAVHRRNPHEQWSILGSFKPSEECSRHAVSLWIQRSTFLFPQNALRPGQICDAAYLVTCNLSVKRSAVLEAGSFDPAFRVGEDTDLGVRLAAMGYRVKYHPSAAAWHEHPSFTTADLLKRAALYGPAHVSLFQKHPQLLERGKSPFGKLLPEDYRRMESDVSERRPAVEAAIRALDALDGIDLFELSRRKQLSDAQLQGILGQVEQLVPLVYWHALFESFLRASSLPKQAIPQTDPQKVAATVLS